MLLSITSQPTFWQTLPFCIGSTFEKTYPSQKISGDWSYVTVEKLDSDGKPLSQLCRYIMEVSSGDLYSTQDRQPPPPVA